jgi:putative methionine-R-sulfoxide reductase with GAF domain
VHKSIELQDVLENAAQSLSENVYNVDIAGVYLIEGTNAVLRAYRGFDKQYIEGASIIPYPKGFTWKTIIEKRVIYCPDVENDTVIGKAGRKLGTKSYVSIPIKSEGLIVGTITINSLKINAFNEDELNLLQEVAQQIELAVNNASRTEALIKSGQYLKRQKRTLRQK